MIRKRILLIILTLAVAVVSSCSDDSDEGIVAPPSKYKDLSERDHVLINLEHSYNDRNLGRLTEILDNDFVFYFSEADVRDGRVPVESWVRASEVTATTNLFDPSYHGVWAPVSAIDLHLTYSDSDTSWKAVTPEDEVTYADETWYEKTVRYTLTVQSGEVSLVGENIEALFVVRSHVVDGRTKWRLVEWHDDVESSLRAYFARASDSGVITEDTTWGVMKYLYAQ